MAHSLVDLNAFLAVVRAGGYRNAARIGGSNASALSDAVRRLEAQLGVRLLHRTTRSISLTDAGARLMARLEPALAEVQAALSGAAALGDEPAGTLRLNVPVSAVRLVLPLVVPAFLTAYPEIRLEITADDSFVDVLAAGCDAGIRYDERLEQDMIAVPIGPRTQRFACAAASAYLDDRGRPDHPRDLLAHACLRGRFASGATPAWEFEREGETVMIDGDGPLLVNMGPAIDLAVEAAVAGSGVIYLFEEWIAPQLESGALEPVLRDWWPSFTGPFLYYSGRRFVPPPLRAFIDFVRAREPLTGARGN